jgi:transposase
LPHSVSAYAQHTLENRAIAKRRQPSWKSCAKVVADEPELLKFFAFSDRWQDGVLAYSDRRETSAAVERLTNKARVVTRRSYGLKSADSLWQRLALEVNRLSEISRRCFLKVTPAVRTPRPQFAA